MMVKKDKTKEKAKRPFHKGGMPPFVPTEVDRAIVQLLVSMGRHSTGYAFVSVDVMGSQLPRRR
jgi:hypothetical protein